VTAQPVSSPPVAAGGPAPRLVIRNATRTFPGVKAVDQVSFEVLPGEIHAMVGENGAGKSTLMHLVAGVYKPDEGEIELDGKSLVGLNEHATSLAGVSMVYQERSLSPALNVAENVFAGRQPTNGAGIIKRREMFDRTEEILKDLEVDIKPGALAGDLSPGQQQMVEIAKGLSHELKLLILDEPTSSLTIQEGRHLFRVLHRLAERGVSIVYVSHRLAEVFEIASRVTVLKDGKVTGVRDTKAVTPNDLMALMVGRELSLDPDPRRAPADAKVALEVQGLVAEPVEQASFTVRYGEIVTLAGLVGAGRTEVCQAIFGARPIQGGKIIVDGSELKVTSPQAAMAAGIGMLVEERKDNGLFLDFTVTRNVVAANLPNYTRGGVLDDRSADRTAQEYVNQLRIATPTVKREVRNLSGGNQQKVMLAKWLDRKPKILIVDEPTRGVDVGAKADIYRLLRELAESGIALLVVSSDLPEVLAISHKIVVMSEGLVVGEMDARDADELKILTLAAPKGERVEERGAA
jgi:ABC-type sugar transport system ATPase subunit